MLHSKVVVLPGSAVRIVWKKIVGHASVYSPAWHPETRPWTIVVVTIYGVEKHRLNRLLKDRAEEARL